MIRRLVKLAAYARAPRATFAVLHPIRAIKWGAALYVGKKLYERVRSATGTAEEAPSPR